ncbi:MAG TPA: tetratricopeptide repeat protein, partial [Rhodospirillales bacterium]|nr:tetratricopeptide repeat protein [Rhodospirillales bacterium]
EQGRLGEAAASYRKALSVDPDYAEAHTSLGTVLKAMGRLEDAAASHEKAIRLKPDLAEAHSNLGSVRQEQGRLGEAAASYRKALTIKPDYPELHFDLGIVHLLMGDFDNGWREYNWRWRMQDFSSRRAEYDKPLWDGGDLGGKRLLVWSEQGIGDEIMFAGLIPDLIERGIDVILESEPRLVPLFARSFPPVTCIAKGGANQPFDFHIPTGGLGQVLRPSLGSFPDPAPYLVADPELRTTLRDRYHNQGAGALVGLAWHSASPYAGRESSLTLPELHPLLETPEVTFVNLQYGDTADQRSAFARETGIDIVHDDQVDQMADMDAFASQVAAMDLVVSIDNSAAQLAGALGVPTWGLLRAVPFWLWGMNGDDSIWYPSMRLFRQSRPGDWNGVIKRVCRALGEWAGSFRN